MKPPYRAPARPGFVLAAICLSVVIVSLDTTVVNVALAALSKNLGASTVQLQWVSDSYLLPYAGLLLLGGAIGDRLGHKRVLLFGLAIFGAGSLLASMTSSVDWLIVFRAFMGVGAAAILPASLATLSAAFPPDQRAKALGIWSAAAGGGVAAGPVLGGALMAIGSWRAAFWINIPLVIIAVIVDAVALTDTNRRWRSLDLPGALFATVAVSAFTATVIQFSTWGADSVLTWVMLGTGMLAAAAFCIRQLSASQPMVHLPWFADRRLAIPTLVAAGLFFAMTGASFALMLYLQLVLGYSPLRSGLAILPAVAATTAIAPLAGTYTSKIGPRILMTTGMLFLAAGIAWFATATIEADYWQRLLPASILFGIGIGLTLTPASDAVLRSVAGTQPGVASGIIETAEELGSALGIASVGAIITRQFTNALAHQPSAIHESAGTPAATISLAHTYGSEQVDQVTTAFTNAMDQALWTVAIIAAATAIVALLHPARERKAEPGIEVAPHIQAPPTQHPRNLSPKGSPSADTRN
jgi:EmrB/QacA subfamily drug resistance transporter